LSPEMDKPSASRQNAGYLRLNVSVVNAITQSTTRDRDRNCIARKEKKFSPEESTGDK
jgi:hypothetical protein